MPENLTELEKVKRINTRFTELVNIRQPWEPLWQEAIDFTGPRRVGVLTVNANSNEGQATGQLMYDGTAGSALQLNADGLQGYTIAASFPWFKTGIPYSSPNVGMQQRREFIKRIDEIPEVKKYLEAKKDMKGRGLPSPDLADALALTFAQKVTKKQRDRFKPQHKRIRNDPHSRFRSAL